MIFTYKNYAASEEQKTLRKTCKICMCD